MKNPKILFTDLLLKYNQLKEVTIPDPELDTDPTHKKYVDDSVTLDTEHSQEFLNPFVTVGGIDKTTQVHGEKVISLLDKIFFPRIAPTYTEGKFIVHDEPINVFLGVRNKHQCTVDIDLGDRKRVVGNISCIFKDALGNVTTTYTNPGSSTKDIVCSFDAKEIDPQSVTELSLTVLLSEANAKKDSYGDESITSTFANNYTISHIVKYRGVLPLFFAMVSPNDYSPVDISIDDIPWTNVTSLLTMVSNIASYVDNIGTREVTMKIPTDGPKKIVLFIPNTPKGVYINDINVLEFATVKGHNIVLPNSRDGVTQLYTGVEFVTGDVAFTKEPSLRIVWESDNYVRLINTPVELEQPIKTDASGHIIVDDYGLEHSYNKKLHITNATVDDLTDSETTRINVHRENAPVDGGYYDEND